MVSADGGSRDARPGDRPGPAPEGPDTTMSLSHLATGEGEAAEPGTTADDDAAIEALPPGSALLVVQRGPNTGARFLLDSDRTTAGRHPGSDIFLDDVTVSRKLAEFVRQADGFLVRDVGSLNGTYVNRERIDSTVLRPGAEVQIGKFRMVYHPSPRDGRDGGGTPT